MEEWIASNLDLDHESRPEPRSPWIRLIDGLPGIEARSQGKASSQWGRDLHAWLVAVSCGIQARGDRGPAAGQNLVKESHVRELACDLLDLIEAGNHRVVLNFQVVERLASWVVIAVEEARRLCEAADGGALKICGLPLQLAIGFPDRGRRRWAVRSMPTKPTAIDSPWPEASRPRRCRSRFCRRSSEERTSRRFAAVHLPRPPELPRATGASQRRADSRGSSGIGGLWLLVQVGSSKGRSVASRDRDSSSAATEAASCASARPG